MLTIFSTGKPFRGHSDVIQRNALKSWTLLHPDVEVVLFGNEAGAAEACQDLGLRHEPHVERNEHGTKYLNYLFHAAQRLARHDLLCYANCDIILLGDFVRALERVAAGHSRFLMVGRRWDTDIAEPLDFRRPDWAQRVGALAAQQNRQRSWEAIDYFAFPRGFYEDLPPFVIGRICWDSWLVWKARAMNASVVDASAVVRAVHQNHDYSYHAQGASGVWNDAQAKRNEELAGGRAHMLTIESATHRLTVNGTRKDRLHWLVPARRWHARDRCWSRWPIRLPVERIQSFGRIHLWHPLLNATRPLRQRLGLRHRKLSKSTGPAGFSR